MCSPLSHLAKILRNLRVSIWTGKGHSGHKTAASVRPKRGHLSVLETTYTFLKTTATEMNFNGKWLKSRGKAKSSIYVGVLLILVCLFWGVWSQGEGREGEKQREEKESGEDKRKDDMGMDAQVLLLMDPGAELGWAVLSDTLPSAGGEREHTSGMIQALFG